MQGGVLQRKCFSINYIVIENLLYNKVCSQVGSKSQKLWSLIMLIGMTSLTNKIDEMLTF